MAETAPAPEVVVYEKPRPPWWKRFRVDTDAILNIRAMLDLTDEEELPEALWIVMGIRKALERRFIAQPWGCDKLVQMIIETWTVLPTLNNKTDFVPGDMVRVIPANRDGAYWHPAPLGKHLINCHGDLFIVRTDEIEAPPSAIPDSEFSKDAAKGALLHTPNPDLDAEAKAIYASTPTPVYV